jgi:hypothetical protein
MKRLVRIWKVSGSNNWGKTSNPEDLVAFLRSHGQQSDGICKHNMPRKFLLHHTILYNHPTKSHFMLRNFRIRWSVIKRMYSWSVDQNSSNASKSHLVSTRFESKPNTGYSKIYNGFTEFLPTNLGINTAFVTRHSVSHSAVHNCISYQSVIKE